jgi:hypothetical protein
MISSETFEVRCTSTFDEIQGSVKITPAYTITTDTCGKYTIYILSLEDQGCCLHKSCCMVLTDNVHNRKQLMCFVAWKCNAVIYVLVRGRPVINLTN